MGNFPEPPHHSGNVEAESSLELLNSDFMRQLHWFLTPTGRITVLSDNHTYIKSLAKRVGRLARAVDDEQDAVAEPLFTSSRLSGENEEDWSRSEDVLGVRVYTGVPGKRGGHPVRVKSSFDRMWTQGGFRHRFYFVVEKCA